MTLHGEAFLARVESRRLWMPAEMLVGRGIGAGDRTRGYFGARRVRGHSSVMRSGAA